MKFDTAWPAFRQSLSSMARRHRFAKRSPRSALLCLGLLVGAVEPVAAAAPQWWQERGVLSAAAANDFAPITQGQLKTLVWAAALEFEGQFREEGDEGLRTAILAILNGWSVGPASGSVLDFAAVSIGQIKTAAAPFYDRLCIARPWVGSTDPTRDHAMGNIGQTKTLFAFDFQLDTDGDHLPDLVEVALGFDPDSDLDLDGNLLADDWEMFYFGYTEVDESQLAERGDGLTILQAFQAGLSPEDFFNGRVPVLSKVSGDQQVATPGTALPAPLVLSVASSAGVAYVNAPITFSIIGASWAGGSNSPVTVHTNSLGRASVSVALPSSPGTFAVTATAGAGINATSAIFSGVAEVPPPPTGPTGIFGQPFLKVRTSFNAEANPAFDTYLPTTPVRRYLAETTAITGTWNDVGDVIYLNGDASWTEKRSLIRGTRYTGTSSLDMLEDGVYGYFQTTSQSTLNAPRWSLAWIGSFSSVWTTGPYTGEGSSGALDTPAWLAGYINQLNSRTATEEIWVADTPFEIDESVTYTLTGLYTDEAFLADTILAAPPLSPWRSDYWGMLIAERDVTSNGTQAFVRRGEYKVVMPVQSPAHRVTWHEVFLPYAAGEPVEMREQIWDYNGTKMESPLYALGPKTKPSNGNWSLFKVDMKVNKTTDEDDDFVAVSNGTDPDLSTELSITMAVPGGGSYTGTLEMKGTDGDIKFDPVSVTLVPGTPTLVKMWGNSHSSARNSSTIQVKIAHGSKQMAFEKKLTVIDGVKLTFEGRFCSPIDAINEYWRPGTRDIEGPPFLTTASAEVIAADSTDLSSSLSFSAGDQAVTLRAWSPAPDVKIKKVEGINPVVELTKDGLKNAEIHMISGNFEHNAQWPPKSRPEFIVNPVMHFKVGGTSIASVAIVSRTNDSQIAPAGSVPFVDVAAKITAAAGPPTGTGNKLARWLSGMSPENTNGTYVHGDGRVFLNSLSQNKFSWENAKFSASKEPALAGSIGAKALLGAQEKRGDNKTSVKMYLHSWDAWDLAGKVEEGEVNSP